MVRRKVHFYGDAPKLSVGRGGSRCWAAGAGSQHVPLSKNLSILFLPINPGGEDITKKWFLSLSVSQRFMTFQVTSLDLVLFLPIPHWLQCAPNKYRYLRLRLKGTLS